VIGEFCCTFQNLAFCCPILLSVHDKDPNSNLELASGSVSEMEEFGTFDTSCYKILIDMSRT
jgi:hypothetical protein